MGEMPSELHCYEDKENIEKYCDFAICLKSFASRDCQRFKTEASDFVANLPTWAFKIQPALSEWGPFDTCSKSCDWGLKKRERTCITGDCDPEELYEYKSCQEKPC